MPLGSEGEPGTRSEQSIDSNSICKHHIEHASDVCMNGVLRSKMNDHDDRCPAFRSDNYDMDINAKDNSRTTNVNNKVDEVVAAVARHVWLMS